MRQCPHCRTTYTDDTLRYCLSDGTPLVMMPGGAEAETVISYHPAKPVVVEIPQSTPAFTPPPSYQQPVVEKRGGISLWIVAGIVALLVLVIAGLGAVLLYQNLSGRESANTVVTANTTTPTPATSKTPTPEKSATPTPWNINKTTPTPSATDRPSGDGTGVTVHSPGDGYLVLRSQPNSSSTEITRIPHGTTIVLTACRDYTTTKSGNYGRWCTTGYSGYSGWVFDAFVRY